MARPMRLNVVKPRSRKIVQFAKSYGMCRSAHQRQGAGNERFSGQGLKRFAGFNDQAGSGGGVRSVAPPFDRPRHKQNHRYAMWPYSRKVSTMRIQILGNRIEFDGKRQRA